MARKPRSDTHATLSLTQEVADKIVALVRAGNYPETASAAAGIPPATMRTWLREGARIRERLGARQLSAVSTHRRPLVTFSIEMEKAMGEAEARDVMLIGRASQGTDKRPGDWRASAFLLERRNKQRWAQRTETEVSGALVHVDASSAKDRLRAKINAARAALLAARAMPDPTDAP